MIKIHDFISDVFYSIARRCFIIASYFEDKAEARRWRLISQDELDHIDALAEEAYAEIEREISAQEQHPKAPHLPS